MSNDTKQFSVDDLRKHLGDLAKTPVADRRAALIELDNIGDDLAAAQRDSAITRAGELYERLLLVVAGLVPAVADRVFGHRGNPTEHPPLSEVMAAHGLVKNTLVRSLPSGERPAAPAEDTKPEPTRAEATDDR